MNKRLSIINTLIQDAFTESYEKLARQETLDSVCERRGHITRWDMVYRGHRCEVCCKFFADDNGKSSDSFDRWHD